MCPTCARRRHPDRPSRVSRPLCSAASFRHAGPAALFSGFVQPCGIGGGSLRTGAGGTGTAVRSRQRTRNKGRHTKAARPARPRSKTPAPAAMVGAGSDGGSGSGQGGGLGFLLGCHTRDSARPRHRRGIDSLGPELRHRPGWPGWPGSPTRLLPRGSRPAGPWQRLGGTQAALGPLTTAQHTRSSSSGAAARAALSSPRPCRSPAARTGPWVGVAGTGGLVLPIGSRHSPLRRPAHLERPGHTCRRGPGA